MLSSSALVEESSTNACCSSLRTLAQSYCCVEYLPKATTTSTSCARLQHSRLERDYETKCGSLQYLVDYITCTCARSTSRLLWLYLLKWSPALDYVQFVTSWFRQQSTHIDGDTVCDRAGRCGLDGIWTLLERNLDLMATQARCLTTLFMSSPPAE